MMAILLGVLAGTFTGLIPGLHVNLVTLLVVGFSSSFLSGFNVFLLVVFIVSLALTHSFLDSIPSIFLGAPDESQVLSVLPGHRFLLNGLGHQAVVLTLVGSLVALLLTFFIIPFGLKFLSIVYLFLKPLVPYLLIIVVIVLLFLSGKFFLNLIFFSFAGLLGLLVFSLPNQSNILLPLLTGLFGLSSLLISFIGDVNVLPKQFLNNSLDLSVSDLEKNSVRATIVGVLAAFLPGLGSSQSAIIASATMKEKSDKDYLLLVGGINTVNFAFSLITLFVIAKARNGAIVGVNSLLNNSLSFNQLLVLFSILLIVGGLAGLLGVFLSRSVSRLVSRIDYKKLLLFIMSFLFLMVFLLSGFQGLLILFTSTALGLLANFLGSQKNMLLGVLLLPTIIFLL